MATGGDVLSMLCPNSEWVIRGGDFDSIEWIKGKPITKAEFEAGFAQYDAWKTEQETKAAADKASATTKLEALGLTADDLKALGIGSN